MSEIPPVDLASAIPDDATCQEASILSGIAYFPCGEPAVAIVYHDRDRRGYYMCLPCTDHNVRNRDGYLLSVKNGRLPRGARELLRELSRLQASRPLRNRPPENHKPLEAEGLENHTAS